MVSKERSNPNYMPEMQIKTLEQTKECTKCKIVLPFEKFYKHPLGRNGLHPSCKKCQSLYMTGWVKMAGYTKSDNFITSKNKYRKSDKYKITKKKYEKSPKVKEYIKEYRQLEKYKNKKRIYARKYVNRKMLEDPIFKLTKNLRGRLRNLLKFNLKSGSAVRDLGCSVPELKIHLENKFQEGMTWENHGKYGWHIDHIMPIKSFDLSNREQFLKACHYTNLQPLWAKDNLSKGSKVIHN